MAPLAGRLRAGNRSAAVSSAAVLAIPSWCSEASPVLDLDGELRPVVNITQTSEVIVGADGFSQDG